MEQELIEKDLPYTARALDKMFNDINVKLENIGETTNKTLEQAIKTNGRVTVTEKSITSLNTWRFGVSMAFGVCCALFVVVIIPLTVYLFIYQTNNLQTQLSNLQTEFKNYVNR